MPSGSTESCAMSGERYLLDTNAVVALLQGDQVLQQRVRNADWVVISCDVRLPGLPADFLAVLGQRPRELVVKQILIVGQAEICLPPQVATGS